MRKVFSVFVNGILLLFILLLVFINFRLHSGPDLENHEETKQSVIKQLNFLEAELKHNELGIKMQQLFPEGFVFVNALYGLSCCEVAKGERDTAIYNHALEEARFAYRAICSEEAKRNFDADLHPAYGIFYNGWKNYLLAKILSVQKIKDTSGIIEFEHSCNVIAEAISCCKSPYPESYANSSWPADAFVAAASLKQHDKIFDVKYDTILQGWLQKVRLDLDPGSGLIPHSVNASSGKMSEGTRGSSISLILIFLAELDPDLAKQQFELFREQFAISHFGLPAIREYPKGKEGDGDVDSGPVIWDMGFSGTIVAAGTFKKFGEYEAANDISSCIEGFGFPFSSGTKKRYLSGKLPVADAFIAWSEMQEPVVTVKGNYDPGATWIFHVLSVAIIFLLVLLIRRKAIKKNKNVNEL